MLMMITMTMTMVMTMIAMMMMMMTMTIMMTIMIHTIEDLIGSQWVLLGEEKEGICN